MRKADDDLNLGGCQALTFRVDRLSPFHIRFVPSVYEEYQPCLGSPEDRDELTDKLTRRRMPVKRPSKVLREFTKQSIGQAGRRVKEGRLAIAEALLNHVAEEVGLTNLRTANNCDNVMLPLVEKISEPPLSVRALDVENGDVLLSCAGDIASQPTHPKRGLTFAEYVKIGF